MIARLRAYMRTPIVTTRGGIAALVVSLGLLASVGIAVSITAVRGLADERSQRSQAQRAEIRHALGVERRRRLQGDALLRRLVALEHPTDAAFRRGVERFLRTLRRHPALAGQVARQIAAAAAPADGTHPPDPSRPPSIAPGRVPPRRSPGTRPDAPRPAGTGPGGQAPGTPPRPRPPVDLPAPTATTPAGTVTVPSVCVGGIGGLGCP